MSSFIESCVAKAAGAAAAEAPSTRSKQRAKKLLRSLAGKQRILVTTHRHPDPDALASSLALRWLLQKKLPGATVEMSIKGSIAGGINDAFTRHAHLELVPWDDATLDQYDAILLLDCQPTFAYTPLPPGVEPFAVIDHHRAPGRKLHCPFCDIRMGVGATSSIIFSYFVDLKLSVPPDLAATLLYAIETDLAGAAGMPTTLDRLALSSLTLVADTNKLYQMRYVDLPRNYYLTYAAGLASAVFGDGVIFSHIGRIESLEQPAIIADFLLRFDQVNWALVTAVHDDHLIFSLRCSDFKRSAGLAARKMIRNIGAGGGHQSKAGGYVRLDEGTDSAAVEKARQKMIRRLMRGLGYRSTTFQPLLATTFTPRL